MRVEFALSGDDVLEAVGLARRGRSFRALSILFGRREVLAEVRLFCWAFMLMAISLTSMVPICIALAMRTRALPWLVVGGLALILLGFIIVVWARVGANTRQKFESDPYHGDPITAQVDDAGYHARSTHWQMDLDWSVVGELRETPSLLLMVEHRGAASMIPKRAFASVHEQEAFAQFIRDRIRLSFTNELDSA
jgi:hypothetical protein